MVPYTLISKNRQYSVFEYRPEQKNENIKRKSTMLPQQVISIHTSIAHTYTQFLQKLLSFL